MRLNGGYVNIVDENAPRDNIRQAENGVDQGRFTTSSASANADFFPVPHFETHTGHHWFQTWTVRNGYILQLDVALYWPSIAAFN